MKPIAKLLSAAVLMVGLSSPAHATILIDQNQSSNTVGPMASFAQPTLAQSFQQTNNNIAGVGINLATGWGTTDTVTISVWDQLSNQAGAHILASGSGTATAGTWFDVFWNAVAIAPGTTYFLEFTATITTLGSQLAIGGTGYDSYSFGQMYAGSSFTLFPTWDYTFRTYYDTAGAAAATVTEPGTFLLLGAGLLGWLGTRRGQSITA